MSLVVRAGECQVEKRLSRRQRQLMDVLVEKGEATVGEILDAMDDPPAYNTVRTLLGILCERGHVDFRKDGRRYVYRPRKRKTTLARNALRRVMNVFFDGSIEAAVASHLNDPSTEIDPEELEALQKLIDEAKRERGES